MVPQGFPGGSVVKNPSAIAGDARLIPGSGRSPGEGNGHPLQCSGLQNSHGQRSLAGHSPWGHKTVGLNWATKQWYLTKFLVCFFLLLKTTTSIFIRTVFFIHPYFEKQRCINPLSGCTAVKRAIAFILGIKVDGLSSAAVGIIG